MGLLSGLRKVFDRRPSSRASDAIHENVNAIDWHARRAALLARIGKARWADPDPAVRRGRVEWVTQEILAVMVFTDPNLSVRLNACRWIMDHAILAHVVATDDAPEVRDIAARYLGKFDAMTADEVTRMLERWETRRRRLRESNTR
jgi:hypothetical protein